MFKAKPLPYIMGNAGDLVKHGLLGEFLSWHLETFSVPLDFYDPFGGRPWQKPMHSQVKYRLARLERGVLKGIQNNCQNQYFGSGQFAKAISERYEKRLKIWVSDADPDAQQDLENSGLSLINTPLFEPLNAYSILNSRNAVKQPALILLDPFFDLKRIYEMFFSQSIHMLKKKHVSVLFFILYKNEGAKQWHQFRQLQNQLIAKNVYFFGVNCPANINSAIKGEAKYHSFIGLYLPDCYPTESIPLLVDRLEGYVYGLQKVLSVQLKLSIKFA